jgi:GntR family transcriptional regulator
VRALTMQDAPLRGFPSLADPDDRPAHTRIEEWLERLISGGGLRTGDKLPAEVEIAAALGVSRMTLRQSLARLEGKGLLLRKRGRWGGNFIAEPKYEVDLTGLPGFTEQMRRAHVRPGARLIAATTRQPPAPVRHQLQLKRGADVHEIIRVRLANREPIAIEENFYPAELFEDLLAKKLTGSLYELLRKYGRVPHSAVETLEPVKASREQAELLRVAPDDPLMLITRTAYSSDGTPIEHAFDYFRADRARITLRTQIDSTVSAPAGTGSGPARSRR